MKLRFLGYVIFVVFCFCVAVYRHFPGDTASTYIQHTLSKFNPKLDIDIKEIKPAFPLGIKTETLVINYAGIPLIGLEKFKLGMDLSSVFSDARRYPFKGGAKEGTFSGSITSPRGKDGQIRLESELKTLVFDHIDLGKHLYDLQLSGTFTGKIVGTIDQQKLKTSQGNITIENALFDLGALDFWMDEIAFSSVAVMFTVPSPGTLKIETCRMKGKQLDLESSGKIEIAPLVENSRLSLAVSILLHPQFFMEAGNSIPAEMAKKNSDGTKFDVTIGGDPSKPEDKEASGATMNKAFIFIHLVLIYFIMDLGVAGGYKFFAGSFEVNELSPFAATEVQTIEKKNSHDRSYYKIISKRDLFKTEEIVSRPEKPGKEEDINELEITDLKLELMGTTTGAGTEPHAVIKQKANPGQMLYVEGDTIDTALIKTILRGKVILVVNGKNQVLLMEKPSSKKSASAGKQTSASGNADGFVDTISLKWADIDQLKTNVKDLRKQIKIRPHFSKGKMDGYRVYGIRKNSEFGKVGLRNGDIISQVNEKEIRTMQDAMGIYEEINALEGKSAMDLGIKRKGKSGIIRYSIE